MTRFHACDRCGSRSHTSCWDPGFYPWNGDYDKQFYDIKLRDGTIVEHCWPNADAMCATNGSGIIYSVSEVVGIRVSEQQGG